jgi:phage baseplate assembly protein W
MPYKNFEITGPGSVEQRAQKQNQFYKGFSSLGTKKSGTKLYDFDLVKQDIINQFNTRRGERVMNPNFGSIIWDLMMEPLTDEVRDALSNDITTICNSDPRVTPTQIKLTEYEMGYVLELTLLLNGTDQSSNLRLTFDQKIGLGVQ